MRLNVNYKITIKASGILDCGRAGMPDPEIIMNMFSEGDIGKEFEKVARVIFMTDEQDIKVHTTDEKYMIMEEMH